MHDEISTFVDTTSIEDIRFLRNQTREKSAYISIYGSINAAYINNLSCSNYSLPDATAQLPANNVH